MADRIGVPYQVPTRYVGPAKDIVPIIRVGRLPATTDKKFPLMQMWIIGKDPSSGTEGDLYYLERFASNGDAIWTKIGAAGGGTGLQTNTADSGSATLDVSDNINLLGNASQGVSTSATSSTVTFTVADATTSSKGVIQADATDFVVSSGTLSLAPGSLDAILTFDGDSGSANPSSGTITMAGGTALTTSASGSTVTFNVDTSGIPTVPTSFVTDSGTAIPASNILNVLGGSGLSTSGATDTLTISGDDATTSTKGVASFDTNDFTVSSGAVSLKGDAHTDTYNADTGSATPSGGAITIAGGTNVTTSATGSTVTINASGSGGGGGGIDNANFFFEFTENTSAGVWSTGGGGINVNGPVGTGHLGVWRFGGGGSDGWVQTKAIELQLGDTEITFECQLKLSDASITGSIEEVTFGLVDFSSPIPANNGVYFHIDNSSSNWFGVSRSGATETALDTGDAANTDWVKLKIVINSAATSVEYFLDDVSKGTIATNIPTSTDLRILLGVRNLQEFCDIDVCHVYFDRTN